jgi:large subunit ribosomal protein L10
MPSIQNVELMKETIEKISRSKTVIVVEYQGLSVKDQVLLRAALKVAGGELSVIKNRLVKIALKDRLKEIPASIDEALNGPCAILFGYDDAVAATKALTEFAKTHEMLIPKVGVLMADTTESVDKIMSPADIEALAKLPGRQELLTMLVIQLASPIQGFYNVLKGNLSGLARVLDGIKKQKETTN